MNIEHLKVSMIWFEPLPRLLREREASSPNRSVSRASDFEREVGNARRGQGMFTFPWRDDTLSYFWRYYLECNPPTRVDAWDAWDHLVPLRRGAEILDLGSGAQLSVGDDSRFQIESFHYPHGIGAVVTVTMEASLELGEAVDRVRETTKGDVLRVSGPERSDTTSVPRLAGEVLDRLRRDALGPAAAKEESLRTDPFSIVTVLLGTVPDPWPGLDPPDDLRRALQGLCTRERNWRKDNLLRLSRCSLRRRSRSAQGDLLFAVNRGRAIWFPSRFTTFSAKDRALGCYHRNLTLASLQTESLLQLVALTSVAIEAPPLPVLWEEVARRGALLLGRLYSGQGSYRSWSTVAQIRRNSSLFEAANRVRDYFGLPPLRRSLREGEPAGPNAEAAVEAAPAA